MVSPFHHSRATPSAWPTLCERAEAILQGAPDATYEGSVTPDKMLAMYHATHTLDNTSLEANHYYSLGRVMCHMGPKLVDLETRQQLTQKAINSVIRAQESSIGYAPGLRIAYIGMHLFISPFHRFTLGALQQTSPSERLLTETLALATSHRRSPIRRSDEHLQWAVEREVEHPDDSIASTRIDENFLSGARIVLRKVLRARGGPHLPRDALVTDVMSYDELRALKLRKFATNCARLRVDEIRKVDSTPIDKDHIIHMNNEGELQVDLEYLRSEPPEVESNDGDPPVSRKERLECPALQAKLIPLVLPMLIDITIGADQQIKSKAQRPSP